MGKSILKTPQWALLFLLVNTPGFLRAQNFLFTKIIDDATKRPDGLGLFTNPHGVSTDGKYVVWNEQGGDLSIWSADLSTLALTRLANNTTAVPGGTGNFTGFGQIGGGPYAGFHMVVRNGTAVFSGVDSTGQGLYSVPAAGGGLRRVVNYNSTLPNGSKIGSPGNFIYTFGLSDNGSVVGIAGLATGDPNSSVYTAGVDGSNLTLIADDIHRFRNPLQNPGPINSCVRIFGGGVAVSNDRVFYFANNGGSFWGLYGQSVAGPVQGVSPDTCGSGPVGPLIVGSGTLLPGDPTPGKQVPDWDFIQTDGQNVYFHGSDWTVGCCSSTGGGFGGIFAVPVGGGGITKIVENGDTLPVIGKVTNVGTEFSVDAGGVVFIAYNESVSPTLRGMFLYSGGKITKVFASGDSLNGATLTQNGSLEVWPQAYKNGKIAFQWVGGVYVAVPTVPSQPPSILSGGVGSAAAYGAFPQVAPGSWVEIYGSNFATHSRTWDGTDFRGVNAPTSLDGTSVTIGGQAAFVDFVGENQVNVQVPSTVAPGPQAVVVTNPAGSSTPATITVNPVQPGLLAPASFLLGGKQFAAALFADSFYVLPPGAIGGVNSRRAKPGDTIILYGIGFGAVQPDTPAGQIAQQSNMLALPFQISIGGAQATVLYAGLAPSFVGLYQFNVVVPSIASTDSAALSFSLNGVPGAQTLVLPVQN
jgi:uncharacterized protein (TIGR03437 family)